MLDETGNISENGVAIAVSIDLSKGSGLLIEGGEWLSFRLKFLQSLFQYIGIVVVAPNEGTITIRTYRAFGEDRATQARGEATTLTLEPARYPLTDSLRGDIEPNRQIEWRPKTRKNVLQAFRLWNCAREAIENKPMATVQPQPIFNKLDDDVIGHEVAALKCLRRF